MPGPTPLAVEGDAELPARVDVVVVGGGIVGASTALELSERGLEVALCEKGGIGHEQSSRNWGWVRISRRDPREVPLMAEALRLWQGLDQRLERQSGYRKTGAIFLAHDDTAAEAHAQWRRHLEPHQIESRMVTGKDLSDLFDGRDCGARAALVTPGDGRAEPQLAASAIAERARERGARILTRCAVRGFETQAGAISAVVTERGIIACSQVVLAGGAWSNLFCANSGLDLPQLRVVSNVLRTEALAGGPDQSVKHKDFTLRKREDGGYTVAAGTVTRVDIVPDSFRYGRRFLPAYRAERDNLRFRFGKPFFKELRRKRRWSLDARSPFEEERVLDPAPSPTAQLRALQEAAKVFPIFAGAKVAQHWSGCIDVTPDAIPVISAVTEVPGFYIATGFSGHGFGIGPGAGRLMADIVTETNPCVDPTPFRFSRFTDGSAIEPQDGL
ncbi:MAG: FAD-binding oxidoreductase [Rhodospirillales bacterium]